MESYTYLNKQRLIKQVKTANTEQWKGHEGGMNVASYEAGKNGK